MGTPIIFGILVAISIPANQDYIQRAEQAMEFNQDAMERMQEMIEEFENQ